MSLFAGRVAIVTGAGSGIGRATALAFAKAGAQVLAADISADAAAVTVAKIGDAGGQAAACATDVTSDRQVAAMVDLALQTFGRLDFAFNNAGISGGRPGFDDFDEALYDRVLATNAKGVWLGMKYEIPAMRQTGGGAIVNMSSVAGLTGIGAFAYTASKHAVIGLTRAAATRFAGEKIRINAVCPGSVETPMMARAQAANVTASAGRSPAGRAAAPEEIAAAVLWLCSAESAFVIGHPLVLDGGVLANPAAMPAAAADGLPANQRLWAHLAVGLAITMSVMDGSIANVALPNIANALHVTPGASIWVVNAYQLSVCMSLLILGSLGDIYGYGRIFRICLVLFTAASLGCALSRNLPGLAMARFVQGMGGAGILGVTNAMLRGIYPKRELAAGIGRNTMVVAVSLVLGPSFASLILAVASWPWLFAVNAPVGVLTLLISARVLPQFPRGTHRFDAGSAVLSAVTFATLVLGIDGLGHQQPDALVAAELAAALICGGILIRRQRSVEAPLLPIDLFRIRLFALSVSTTFLASMAQLMAYVAIPFLLHGLGRGQVAIGLLITPWPVMVGLLAPFAGKLSRRIAPGILASTGLVLLAAGLVMLALLPPGASTLEIICPMLLCGIGYGLFLPPNAATQIAAAPKARSGGASTMGATSRVLGQSIGAALVAGMFGLFPLHGIALALLAAAGIALAGGAVSIFRVSSRSY